MHYGFLDRDALMALQKWLKRRKEIMGDTIREGEPLFIGARKGPITEGMIRKYFHKLAETSGVQKKLDGYELNIRYQYHPHELRDLLKSLATSSGVHPVVSEYMLGHSIDKLHYDKSPKTSPEFFRSEFKKLSPVTNFISNTRANLEFVQQYQDMKQEKEEAERVKEVTIAKSKEITTLTKQLKELQDWKDSVTQILEDAKLKPAIERVPEIEQKKKSKKRRKSY